MSAQEYYVDYKPNHIEGALVIINEYGSCTCHQQPARECEVWLPWRLSTRALPNTPGQPGRAGECQAGVCALIRSLTETVRGSLPETWHFSFIVSLKKKKERSNTTKPHPTTFRTVYLKFHMKTPSSLWRSVHIQESESVKRYQSLIFFFVNLKCLK